MRRLLSVVAAIMFAMVMAVPSVSLAQGNQGFVSIIHASPDAPAVDVYVNGARVLNDVPFFAASPYLPLDAGSYEVAVTPAGADIGEAVINGSVTVEAGQYITVAAVNTLENIEAVAFVDDLSAPPAGQTRVSLIHASPDAPAVDVKIAGTDTVVIPNIAFKQGVEISVPAGTYQFDISPAGSADVVFTTPQLRFESGWVYTLVATGQIGQGGFWVQSVVDSTGS